jgi:hypothetical protein
MVQDDNQDLSKGETWLEDEEGCSQVDMLEMISKHEAKCGYAFVTCKYSTKCDKLRRLFQKSSLFILLEKI